MTDTTNEQIALELGWVHDPDLGTWYAPDFRTSGIYYLEAAPDYEHDWAHTGSLLEELLEAETCENGPPFRLVDSDRWCVPWYNPKSSECYESVGDTLTQAIARAWLAWKKEE